MRFKDYIYETIIKEPAEHRGKTSKDHGHYHDYFIKHVSGNGRTGKVVGKGSPHTHKIKKMIIQTAKDGHTHEIET